jgi:vacuolar-type H+-ATPase subunit I/STV1
MGIDPIWGITSNKLQFVNVIKMKVSVIMAIFHMSIGIIMKGTNSVYFGRWADLITEVIFGLIIFWGLFGWMDLLIIAKWFNNIDIEDTSPAPDILANRVFYDTDDEEMLRMHSNYGLPIMGDYINRRVPSIINIMIVAVFNFGAYTDEFEPVIGDSNADQYGIAITLLIIVLILCPMMLFIKPCMAGFADHGEEDKEEIEFTNINRGEGMQEPMIGA